MDEAAGLMHDRRSGITCSDASRVVPVAGRSKAMFIVEQRPEGYRVQMSATLENIDRADALCREFLEARHVPVDSFATRILLREAVLNAVTHGCGSDPDRHVHLEIALDRRGIVLEVEDHGGGFIWQDRAAVFDVEGDGGRGLALMRIYASAMEFNETGNRVVLRRDYEPETVAGMSGRHAAESNGGSP